MGRFLQIDPIDHKVAQRLFLYVLNNPINFIDPSGLMLEDATVVCDGEGGFEVQLGWAEDEIEPISECVEGHEEYHIEDFEAFMPDACKDSNGCPKEEGTSIPVEDDELLNFMECGGYTEEASCLLDYLMESNLTPEDREQVQDRFEFASLMASGHCGH